MPEVCRTILVGFDPVIVKGYLKTGARALWFYLPEELYTDLKIKPGSRVSGKLLHVYGPDGTRTASPDEPFHWETAKETGMAVNVPAAEIIKHGLTEFHFLEVRIDKIEGVEVYPGKEMSRKLWPEDKMKLAYSIKFMPP